MYFLGNPSKQVSLNLSCVFVLLIRSIYFASTPQCRPEIFRSTTLDDSSGSSYRQTSQQEEENKLDSSDDDGLPPIEVNTNRIKPVEFDLDAESDSCSDVDS